MNGKIVRSLSGFYSIESEGKLYVCKARGLFRKNEISPVTGDNVVFEEAPGESNGEFKNGIIKEILERKNFFTRPPIANLDQIFFIVSTCEPGINTSVLDKLIAISENKNVAPLIVVTKTDLASHEDIERIYTNSGFDVIVIAGNSDAVDGGIERIKSLLTGKVSAFAGNTGVGKSTLLNNLLPNLELPVNEISRKLGRGRHTTRHVELFELPSGGYVADTPGFSSVETLMYDVIFKEELENCFREFGEYIGECKFKGCSHTVEAGCAVLNALNNGLIEKSRHDSYVNMYNEAKNIKKWEHSQKTFS